MRAVSKLRVATLNIWGRQGPWESRLPVLRRALAALKVDLIGLQEVIRFEVERAPSPATGTSSDQAMEIGEGLGLQASFGAALDLGFGYSFGNAILSRFPIRSSHTTTLPGEGGVEPRALHSAIVDAPFGPVLFASTHLAWRFDEGALRVRQVLAIAGEIDRQREGLAYPPILVGDFNAEPDSDEMRFLRGLHTRDGRSTYFIDAFGEAGKGPGSTYDRGNDFARALNEPDRRIDYVLVRGRDARGWGMPISCLRAFDEAASPAADAPVVFASDHFGVVADLRAPGSVSEVIS